MDLQNLIACKMKRKEQKIWHLRHKLAENEHKIMALIWTQRNELAQNCIPPALPKVNCLHNWNRKEVQNMGFAA